jgi:hypothetical protein
MAVSRLMSASTLLLIVSALPSWAQLQTTISPTLPNLNTGENEQTGDKTAAGPDATYCRPPQHRTDSRLPGPQVCMTIRKWNDLHANGLDVGPDGSTLVPIQKQNDVGILSH